MGEVMVRPEVGQYQRFALVGLEPESEAVFREIFQETFPEAEFAERDAVLQILPEEILETRRIESDTRERVGGTLGVQGIIVLFWEDSGTGGTLDWEMTITDVETGATTGNIVARVRKEPLARGAAFEDLEKGAYEALVSALEERITR